MTEEQLNTFIYSCLSFANKAHFDNERYIINFLNKSLNESSFCDVIMRNYKIAQNLHFGVCFTMSCWAYHLLYTMGVSENVFILETTEKGTGFPNYVLLYKYLDEYRICDLGALVQSSEKARNTIFQVARDPEYFEKYDKDALNKALKKLVNSKFINQKISDYLKKYNAGFVFDADGIDDTRIFTEIPQVYLGDFLKRNNLTFKK